MDEVIIIIQHKYYLRQTKDVKDIKNVRDVRTIKHVKDLRNIRDIRQGTIKNAIVMCIILYFQHHT